VKGRFVVMGWNSILVLVIVYGAYRIARHVVDSGRQREAKLQAAEQRLADAEGRLKEIGEKYKNYKSIDRETRMRLRAVVEERTEKLDLSTGPGDLEAAVVRIYQNSRSRLAKPSRE
jgi:hypothetical protein